MTNKRGGGGGSLKNVLGQKWQKTFGCPKQLLIAEKHQYYFSGTFAPVRYSGFGIRFRYSVFTVFPDLKDFHDI